jgi:hypothetical protein
MRSGEMEMFRRFFGGRTGGRDAGKFEPRMPEVAVPTDSDTAFDPARAAAAGTSRPADVTGQQVIVVTPGRTIMFLPCPPAGSMAAAHTASMERLISPAVKRNVAAIAYTELEAVKTDASRAIPFLGILLGLAYIGHAVWVFEGHPTALAAGCRDADVLIVDGGMVPHLQPDWQTVAASRMRRPEIYVHDRAAFALRKPDSL